MLTLVSHPARIQPALASKPYDRWVTPEGEVKAEFHRPPEGFLVRFPGEADFAIDLAARRASGWPAPETTPDHFESLFQHGIVPLVGNYLGGLFLHGSAVAVGDKAIAFLGLSRSGKTTLAGAFAKAGYPFLTEDVIELALSGNAYMLQPKHSRLRLFVDSAAWLLEREFPDPEDDDKHSLAAGENLPFAETAVPLARIYVLGRDHDAPLAINPFVGPEALAQLLPHAFVLDVEDKPRLRAHFERIGQLSERIPVCALDYPRRYGELPMVISAILAEIRTNPEP
ncbi:hypothetical protein [Erythrobacter tepidarius]|uniref:hypothetical protein n=1 Tax=Erythrobacter tepidarius TaxID=60454 RepID=UPI000A3B0477|nr:hypothetical protein [Erythrobacter tepidarius]